MLSSTSSNSLMIRTTIGAISAEISQSLSLKIGLGLGSELGLR